jgi:hypothetical protein
MTSWPLPNGSELIKQYHVSPIGPETSRTYDGGVDQQLWNGRARITLTYFHNEFTNGVEFVPQSALLALGCPPPATPRFNMERRSTPRPSAPRGRRSPPNTRSAAICLPAAATPILTLWCSVLLQ